LIWVRNKSDSMFLSLVEMLMKELMSCLLLAHRA
jgi:hypothetical protein